VLNTAASNVWPAIYRETSTWDAGVCC